MCNNYPTLDITNILPSPAVTPCGLFEIVQIFLSVYFSSISLVGQNNGDPNQCIY